MMIGTIIGEISIAMIIRRNGISGRDSPSAASVPSIVARMVEKMPMMTEFLAALTQRALAQTSAHQAASRGASGRAMPKVSSDSYQRSEYPSGSKLRIRAVKVK